MASEFAELLRAQELDPTTVVKIEPNGAMQTFFEKRPILVSALKRILEVNSVGSPAHLGNILNLGAKDKRKETRQAILDLLGTDIFEKKFDNTGHTKGQVVLTVNQEKLAALWSIVKTLEAPVGPTVVAKVRGGAREGSGKKRALSPNKLLALRLLNKGAWMDMTEISKQSGLGYAGNDFLDSLRKAGHLENEKKGNRIRLTPEGKTYAKQQLKDLGHTIPSEWLED